MQANCRAKVSNNTTAIFPILARRGHRQKGKNASACTGAGRREKNLSGKSNQENRHCDRK